MRPFPIMIALASAAMLTPAALAQTAPQWELALQDKDGEVRFNPASVKRDGQRVIVDTRATLTVPKNGMSRIDGTVLLDCAGWSSGFLSGTAYDPAGKITGSRTTEPKDVVFAKAELGSIDEVLLKRLCTKG